MRIKLWPKTSDWDYDAYDFPAVELLFSKRDCMPVGEIALTSEEAIKIGKAGKKLKVILQKMKATQ